MSVDYVIYFWVAHHNQTQKYDRPEAQTLCEDTTYIHHNRNSQILDIDIVIFEPSKLCELWWMDVVAIWRV
mgnify:CR=1 FL=1